MNVIETEMRKPLAEPVAFGTTPASARIVASPPPNQILSLWAGPWMAFCPDQLTETARVRD